MKRRKFMKYSTLATGGFVVGAALPGCTLQSKSLVYWAYDLAVKIGGKILSDVTLNWLNKQPQNSAVKQAKSFMANGDFTLYEGSNTNSQSKT